MAKKTKVVVEQVVTELPELEFGGVLPGVAPELQPAGTVVEQAAAPVVVAQANQVMYRVVAPKRPLTGVKFGVSGNEFTHNALAVAATANGGTLTDQQARQVCVDAAHKGFYSYAVKRLKILVPVEQEAAE